jgi:SAM-dependent methyltransferase
MTTTPTRLRRAAPRVLACPVCDSPAPPEHSFDDVHLHRCAECGHCFTDVESLEYPGEYDEAWEALHENWFANPNFELFAFIAARIAAYRPNATVIDVGCGRGELLSYLRERYPLLSLTGVDASLHPEVAGVEFIRADINSVDFGERRWDVAVSLATIEHVADVKSFAERLWSLLLPGGLAIVATNNEQSVSYDVARIFRRLGYRDPFERLYDRHHLNHFNVNSLRTLMQRTRFRPIRLHRHNIPLGAVDMPKESTFLKLGVWLTFALGRLTGRTFFQTLVLEKDPL